LIWHLVTLLFATQKTSLLLISRTTRLWR